MKIIGPVGFFILLLLSALDNGPPEEVIAERAKMCAMIDQHHRTNGDLGWPPEVNKSGKPCPPPLDAVHWRHDF